MASTLKTSTSEGSGFASQERVLRSIARALDASALIRRHDKRHYGTALCIIRLADVELMAGSLGTATADLAIAELASRLSGALRGKDELIQLSPRRWAIVLKGVTGEDHLTLALARIERQLAEPLRLLDEWVMLRANLGYAVAEDGEQTAEAVYWRAEESLTEARRADTLVVRNARSAIVHDQGVWSLRQDLQRALEEGEFTLYFQPKVNARFGHVVGAEALVRWHSRKRGLVGPAGFIEVLEQSELVTPFTHFIIKHALALASQWPAAIPVAVNVPPTVLADPGLPVIIADALAIFDIAPAQLCVEVTEGSMMRDLDVAIARLQELKELGLSISVDDFGTGHSSLATLRDLPLSELKIDRSFVVNLERQPKLVQYIIDLAHGLDLGVVAEGVEDPAAMTRLADMGVDTLQGYAISRPLPQAEFLEWLRSRGV